MSWSIVFLFQGRGEGDPNVPVGVPPGLLSNKCEIKKSSSGELPTIQQQEELEEHQGQDSSDSCQGQGQDQGQRLGGETGQDPGVSFFHSFIFPFHLISFCSSCCLIAHNIYSSYFPIGHNSISNNCRSERQISPVFLASTIQAAGSISSARRSSKKLNIPSQSLRRIFHSRIQMEMLTQGLLKSLGRSRRASARSASDGSGRRLAFCGRAARRRGQSVTPRLARFS